jgi:LysR family glycine cleavage system transcriptional activator
MPVSLVRMPSLDLIKGFVAVGRRMSVSQAADDLCVTQSAVSKQLRTLEDLLGVRLLQRGHRSVSFTLEGERLFRVAENSIQQLQDVLGTFGECAKRPVSVTASMGVAGLWLLPRLGKLQQLHPEIDLRVTASNSVLDLASENLDLAIRYCHESQAPRGALKLFDETVAPVCSPSLPLHSVSTLGALRHQVLLEFEDRRQWLQWSHWLVPRGLHPSDAKGMLRFNHYDQAIHAAVAGQGVALGRLELVAPMLEDGRLKRLCSESEATRTSRSYWLIKAEDEPREDVVRVSDWFVSMSQDPHVHASAPALIALNGARTHA